MLLAMPQSGPDLSAHVEARCFSQREAIEVVKRAMPGWRIRCVSFMKYAPRGDERTAEVMAFLQREQDSREWKRIFGEEKIGAGVEQ